MAVTIVATPGSADANSFATEAEADTYMEARLNASAWTGASEDSRRRALVEATRELNNLESQYKGYRVDSVQALCWPRRGAINTDAPLDAPLGDFTGYPEYDDDEVPVRLKNATIELALAFLKAGTTDIASLDTDMGVIRKKLDVIETEWSESARPVGLSRYPRVLQLVSALFVDGASNTGVVRS